MISKAVNPNVATWNHSEPEIADPKLRAAASCTALATTGDATRQLAGTDVTSAAGFVNASQGGDIGQLLDMLAADVAIYSDSGGNKKRRASP